MLEKKMCWLCQLCLDEFPLANLLELTSAINYCISALKKTFF